MKISKNLSGNAVLIGIVAISIIGVLGIVLFQSKQFDSSSTVGESSEIEKKMLNDQNLDDKKMQEVLEEEEDMANASYLTYSPNVLSDNADKKRVLYFYANWCPICRPVDAEFKANANKIPDDVVIIRVNYNDSDTDASEDALAEKYGITYQHTFVQIDENGEAVKIWNSGGLEELLERI